MYDLVYAVNQQYPKRKEGNAGGLLILTKFAELVADSNNPRKPVSQKRFCAMTRMTRNTVKAHLKELEAANFLVPLDDPNAKHTGDPPILYELRLPEGFNREEVMQRHYKMYYGGEYLYPNDINLKIGKGKDMMLPPVSAEVVADTEASEFDNHVSEFDKDASKIDKEVSKIDPYNNIKNINNNKPNVSADAVDDFLKKYCEDTKKPPAFFKKHGITKENVNLLEKCITFWKDAIANSKKEMRNPIGFLVKIIKDTVAKGKFDDTVWITQHEPKPLTINEISQKCDEIREKIKEQERTYEYPEVITSAAKKITKTALDKFNIMLNENNICDLLDRHLHAKPERATDVANDFEKNCALFNKSEKGVTDWLRDSILRAIGITI